MTSTTIIVLATHIRRRLLIGDRVIKPVLRSARADFLFFYVLLLDRRRRGAGLSHIFKEEISARRVGRGGR